MDVVIKSCNRTYILDRVIQSVYRYCVNGLGRIVVLDDGSPEKFLKRISEKYPDVIIKKSPDYTNKMEGKGGNVPLQFWRQEIQNVTENFLLLEDDIWLVGEVDLNRAEELIQANDISLLKLCWWGNNSKNKGILSELSSGFQLIKPTIPNMVEYMVKNKWYIHSLALLLKLRPKNYFLQLYTYYDVAGHIFNRNFYNYVWPSDQSNVQEMIQLGKAAEWYRKFKNKKIAKSMVEKAATTFLSSSTGNRENLGFDMDTLNLIWNDCWYRGKLDTMFNFPKDFTLDYLASFASKLPISDLNAWKKWSVDWRHHFIELGSDIDTYNNTYECK